MEDNQVIKYSLSAEIYFQKRIKVTAKDYSKVDVAFTINEKLGQHERLTIDLNCRLDGMFLRPAKGPY